jgi:hypothetical protein
MKNVFMVLACLSFASAHAEEGGRETTRTFGCSFCSTERLAPACDLQAQAAAECQRAGFPAATIHHISAGRTLAGGFCFDGSAGGRMYELTYSVDFTCVAN